MSKQKYNIYDNNETYMYKDCQLFRDAIGKFIFTCFMANISAIFSSSLIKHISAGITYARY